MDVLLNPYILCGFALAAVLLVIELRTSATGWLLPVLSVCLSVIFTVVAVLLGGTLQEIIIVAAVFCILMSAYLKRGKR